MLNKYSPTLFIIFIFLIASCNSEQNKTPKTIEETIVQNAPPPSTGETIVQNNLPPAPTRQNQFKEVIQNVAKIDYELKEYQEINKSENFLTTRIAFLNSLREDSARTIKPEIKLSNVVQVRSAFIKGTKDLGGHTYTRANVESWEMTNEEAANFAFDQIQQIKNSRNWERISKSPITCFKTKNEIIFITPGGFYMLDKVPIIENYLKENL